jgi:hypothetical protein
VEGVIELQRLGGVVGPELLDRSGGAGLGELRLGAGSLHLTGRARACRAVGGGKRGRVGRLDDDLQVGIAGLDIVQRERVHRTLIGDEVEVGVNAFLRRMKEAVVAYRVDDPEIFVAGGDLQNLLRCRAVQSAWCSAFCADTYDVVGVVLDEAGGLLAVGHGRGQAKQERDDG